MWLGLPAPGNCWWDWGGGWCLHRKLVLLEASVTDVKIKQLFDCWLCREQTSRRVQMPPCWRNWRGAAQGAKMSLRSWYASPNRVDWDHKTKPLWQYASAQHVRGKLSLYLLDWSSDLLLWLCEFVMSKSVIHKLIFKWLPSRNILYIYLWLMWKMIQGLYSNNTNLKK